MLPGGRAFQEGVGVGNGDGAGAQCVEAGNEASVRQFLGLWVRAFTISGSGLT